MGNFLYKIYQQIAERKIAGLLALLVLVIGFGALASKITFEEDITKLIPVSTENADYQKVLQTVKFTDKIIVNIQREPNSKVSDITGYATTFLDSLVKQSDYVEDVQGKISDDVVFNTIDFVYENLPLFLEGSDYAVLEQKTTRDSLVSITKQNYNTLISPTGIIAKKTILKDPLGLSFIAMKKLQSLGVGDDFTLKDGFLLTKDEQHILLFITPKYPSSETDKNTNFSIALYKIQEELNTQYKGKVNSEYFGAALVAVANANQIKNDIQFTVGIALTLLLVILVFFYRKLTVPIVLFLPTLFGGLLSVAILYLLRGNISAISLGIGSVLLGVTLDYSLHILTHIRNNKSIESLYVDVAPSILMSSLTTASAFLCLLFIKSQALQDLGIFAAISVLGASVFALLLIPQIYSSKESKTDKNNILDRLASYEIHKNKIVLSGIALALFISIFTYNKVIFNTDIAKMNYEPKELLDARNNLEKLTDLGSKSIYAAAYGSNLETALQINDSIYSVLKENKLQGNLKNFSSIGALVASKKKQKEKIQRWKEFWNAKKTLQTKNDLIETGKTFGFKPYTFNAFYNVLEKDFTPLSLVDYEAIDVLSISDFIGTKEGFTAVTSLIKVDTPEDAETIKRKLSNDQTILIDRQGMNEAFLGNLKNDFNQLIGYSVLVVLVLLLLFYKSFSVTLVTGIPIFLTWFLTIGVMGLLHIEFNIFNIIISTFIFGLGVDYSIFITNGLLAENRTGEKVLPTHKTSILLSVITTILGVGVLVFAKHPALYTISVVSLVGILSAVLIAFAIQPLLFKLFIGNKTKRPVSFRLFIHSALSFGYFGLGGLVLSLLGIIIEIIPLPKKIKMGWFHRVISKLMGSVLYTNRFLDKKVINLTKETFKEPVMIIANHTSFLDILAIGMLHPKIVFLVNDWVYNSPVFGRAVRAAGFYPVTNGVENGEAHLRTKVAQGYSLITFPEGTRSTTNKIKRFHKGAFHLAEKLNLHILPILIHGNSEVNPKGSSVIRDGSLTVKILDKIAGNDISFGRNTREQTKQISTYFRDEFKILRGEIEDALYFHSLVLLEYRYKGDVLHNAIKEDLKTNALVYKEVLDYIDSKATILHLSQDFGQLDFLLKLDAPDRKINVYLKDTNVRQVVANSYIAYNYGKMNFPSRVKGVFTDIANVAIVNLALLDSEDKISLLKSEITILILLKEGKSLQIEDILENGFKIDKEISQALFLKRHVKI
ncbi:1-acyl-sn-glycerol-3-phosphate acyltransferase [Maribacter sp.]|uniref:1-acyl-sn-glycerol-3-phosphate acyltransferase n=1 Tax=Maribacter sp. TaxID=1897614 RepID=UPI0025C4F803|nr:1-acyl-sn-glycerol-3-phosphate acyltransferase [Maribacter sp.]